MNAETGAEYEARRVALGLNKGELAELAGIDSATLNKVLKGDPKVRATTVGAVDQALSKLEHELEMDRPDAPPEDDLNIITFRVEPSGAVTVKAPVAHMDALLKAVAELTRERNTQD